MGLFDFLRRKPRVTLSPPADMDALIRVAREMTAFDMLVGRLCSEYYREDSDIDRAINYGILGVFHDAVGQAVSGEIEAEELLDRHAAKNGDAAALVGFARAMVGQIVQTWDQIERASVQQFVPVSVGVATVLVRIAETQFRRPRADVMRGHFAVLADFAVAVALHLAVQAPERARFLAEEDV
jgi:hypothetical protein